MPPPAEKLLFHAGRLLWPALPLSRPYVALALAQTLESLNLKGDHPTGRFHTADWWLAKACLWDDQAGSFVRDRAWGILMRATMGREGRLLSERLNARAWRLFPADTAAREEALGEFWGHLLVGPHGGPGRLQVYQGTQPLVPWLVTTFRNLCVDKLRRQGRAPLDLGHGDDWPMAQATLAAEDPVLVGIVAAKLDDFLAGLTDRQRRLASLRYTHGLNQKGVASALGTTEATISRDHDRIQDLFEALVNQVDERVEASREAVVEAILLALAARLDAGDFSSPLREVANA